MNNEFETCVRKQQHEWSRMIHIKRNRVFLRVAGGARGALLVTWLIHTWHRRRPKRRIHLWLDMLRTSRGRRMSAKKWRRRLTSVLRIARSVRHTVSTSLMLIATRWQGLWVSAREGKTYMRLRFCWRMCVPMWRLQVGYAAGWCEVCGELVGISLLRKRSWSVISLLRKRSWSVMSLLRNSNITHRYTEHTRTSIERGALHCHAWERHILLWSSPLWSVP